MFKVHFSPALLYFSFPSCWLPFQARNLSLTVVYGLNWNDSSQYVAWKQISNYFVSNCRMYVKEYLDINRKMRGDRDRSREADSWSPLKWNGPPLQVQKRNLIRHLGSACKDWMQQWYVDSCFSPKPSWKLNSLILQMIWSATKGDLNKIMTVNDSAYIQSLLHCHIHIYLMWLLPMSPRY